jgi:hypothetical protein
MNALLTCFRKKWRGTIRLRELRRMSPSKGIDTFYDGLNVGKR